MRRRNVGFALFLYFLFTISQYTQGIEREPKELAEEVFWLLDKFKKIKTGYKFTTIVNRYTKGYASCDLNRDLKMEKELAIFLEEKGLGVFIPDDLPPFENVEDSYWEINCLKRQTNKKHIDLTIWYKTRVDHIEILFRDEKFTVLNKFLSKKKPKNVLNNGEANLTKIELAYYRSDGSKNTGLISPEKRILDFSGKNLTRIEGLEKLEDLEEIRLGKNSITNLDFLKNCKGLKRVIAPNNNIKSISELGEMSTLEMIALDHNEIEEIPDLSRNKNLKSLFIQFNRLRDVHNVRNFPELISLLIRNNRITKLSDFNNIPKLNRMDLSMNQITDVSMLRNVKSVRELFLWGNKIQDFKPIGELTNLSLLDMGANNTQQVPDIFSNLKKLSYLNLQANGIKKIQNLDELTQLKDLILEGNQIEKIEGLGKLQNLIAIDFGRNKLKHVEGLENLKNLKKISLRQNQIPLAEIKTLQSKYQIEMDDAP